MQNSTKSKVIRKGLEKLQDEVGTENLKTKFKLASENLREITRNEVLELNLPTSERLKNR